jgi:hypothetical protein
MRYQRRVCGAVGAGLLCAALAGCGTTVVTAQSTPAAQSSASATTGCGAVNQATAVTVHLVEPTSGRPSTTTRREPTLVRALFRDFCNAVAHPPSRTKPVLLQCPMDSGLDYTGTFYAGTRVLGTFVYGASGCQTVSLTAAGTTKSTTMFGPAAAAAPHLESDMAAVLGQPETAVYAVPQATVNPGGPDQP